MKNFRVLITGGAGFIGSHVADKLVAEGCEVLVLDNLSTGLAENLQHHLDIGKVSLFRGDIRDEGLVNGVVKEVDAIVHLAAITNVPNSVIHPVLTNEVNVGGTLNLLRASLDGDVKRFLLVSSCAVYGEPHYVPVDEEHPTDPLSPYAASKLAAEYYCRVFRHSYGLKTEVLRPFNVYGPRQRREDAYSGVITRFVDNLFCGKPLVVYGDGSQTRDFVHVYDVAEAVWLALSVDGAVGQVLNVGYGESVKVGELAKMFGEFAGAQVEIVYEEPRPGDLKHSQADVTKAKKILGYNPKIPLAEGLRNLLRAKKEIALETDDTSLLSRNERFERTGLSETFLAT